MSKTYIVSRNGGTVSKAPVNDNKIPIYANKTAMEADASNIPEGAIVFTKSDHDDVIDQMKAYIRNQNVLSDYESITLSTDSNNPTVMRYDGFLTLAGNSGGSGGVLSLWVNSESIQWGGENTTNISKSSLTVPFKKGDSLYFSTTQPLYELKSIVAYYKNRDYSDRT